MTGMRFPVRVLLLSFLFLVLIEHVSGADIMVCKSVPDADFSGTSTQGTNKRIQALEEQVRQLQKLVDEKNVSGVHKKIEGLPRGKIYLILFVRSF